MQATQDMVGAMGVNSDLLDSACCGMTGSFGYERSHYDVAMKVGEHVLLGPAPLLAVHPGGVRELHLHPGADERQY